MSPFFEKGIGLTGGDKVTREAEEKIGSMQPAVTAFLALILLRDSLTGIQMLGIASAVFGVGTMASSADWHVVATFDFNIGDLVCW